MKKVLTWILNHLAIVLGVVVFTTVLVVSGCIMLKSHKDYQAYEVQYNENDLEVRSLFDAQPKYIEIADNFKSEYKNELALAADELTVTSSSDTYMVGDYIDLSSTGGSISVNLSLEERSFVDIDFLLSTEYEYKVDGETEVGIKELLSNVTFVVNGQTMEEEGINLNGDGWHHLVMVGFALPEGDVTVKMQSNSGKNAMMPLLKNITFHSSAVLEVKNA